MGRVDIRRARGVGKHMDWLNRVTSFALETPTFPADFTAWDFLNSNLLLAVVGAAFTWVFRQEAERQRKNEDLKLQNDVQKSLDESDTQDAQIASADANPNLRQASEIIRRLKDAIEQRTTEDLRFKKTYDKIARYDYVPLIEAMKTRNLKDASADELISAFNLYKPYRNGRREMPGEDLQKLRRISRKLEESDLMKKFNSKMATQSV